MKYHFQNPCQRFQELFGLPAACTVLIQSIQAPHGQMNWWTFSLFYGLLAAWPVLCFCYLIGDNNNHLFRHDTGHLQIILQSFIHRRAVLAVVPHLLCCLHLCYSY